MYVKKIKSTKIISTLVYAMLLVASGWYLHAKFTPDFAAMAPDNTPPHVLVKNLIQADISVKKKYIAQVEPINAVDIVPQVSGYLEKIMFKDGSFINKGDEIFLIEQRKYKADLKSAEAAVKQLKADYNRIKSLHQKRFVSDKERDIAESNLEQAEAALDLAKLNLEYTRIKSPISGYIGKALVTEGNLVSPETPKLARVVQTMPIRIAFSVSDKERSAFMQKISSIKDIVIDVVLPNGTTETVPAQNLFFDNEVNPETATIPVYVDVENNDNLLVVGNYVDIYVRFNKPNKAVLVPQVALSADINGSYVMIVKDDNTVEQKYLQLGDVIDDNQVVISGLDGTEKVIIQGLQKIKNGMSVVPTSVDTLTSKN